jgi:hypothetical protein
MAGQGAARFGRARHGRWRLGNGSPRDSGEAPRCTVRAAGNCGRGQAGHGAARRGGARQGMGGGDSATGRPATTRHHDSVASRSRGNAEQGLAGPGLARLGRAWHGRSLFGGPRLGWVRQLAHRSRGSAGLGSAGLGMARHGRLVATRAATWAGDRMVACPSRGQRGRGSARRGLAGHGMAWGGGHREVAAAVLLWPGMGITTTLGPSICDVRHTEEAVAPKPKTRHPPCIFKNPQKTTTDATFAASFICPHAFSRAALAGDVCAYVMRKRASSLCG